jgi:hypothetical protein
VLVKNYTGTVKKCDNKASLPNFILQFPQLELLAYFFITPVYLQYVQNTMSKWEETETNGEEESSVALIHMEEAQGLEW